MKKSESTSFLRAPEGAKKNAPGNNWKEVLVDIILKVLTLGFYHLEKHRKKDPA